MTTSIVFYNKLLRCIKTCISFSLLTSPHCKWFRLPTQISFIKFQFTIKGGPLHYLHSYHMNLSNGT